MLLNCRNTLETGQHEGAFFTSPFHLYTLIDVGDSTVLASMPPGKGQSRDVAAALDLAQVQDA